MPQILPLIPSDEHYEFATDLDGHGYVFTIHWNSRDGDGAWYMAAAEDDGTVIMAGVKIVLGAFLGRQYRHRLTHAGALIVTDAARSGIDAGFDDLGVRIIVAHWTSYEIAAAIRAYGETLRTA